STAAMRNGQSIRGNEDADVSSVVVVMCLFTCHPGRAQREPGTITAALAIPHQSWLWIPDSRCAASGMTASLRPETERLLQVIPLGACRGKRGARIGGPVDHGAVIEPHVLAAEQLGEHEPVGRGPMPRVAVGQRGTCGQRRG